MRLDVIASPKPGVVFAARAPTMHPSTSGRFRGVLRRERREDQHDILQGYERRLRGAFARSLLLALFSLGGVAASKAADPSPEEQKKTLSAVPADAQKYYGGYWYAGNVVADPFADWKPHPPPWQICHNDSYLGNSWRANLVAELKALTKQLADQGLAKPDLIVTNSNGDINLELSQLKAQVAQGCDIIMSYPGSATGLCSGIKDAYNKGVLFVAIDSPVTCPEGLNVATNPYYRGQFGGEWIAKQLNGKGNVIVMNGQPGTANTVAQETGLRQTVASDPGMKVVGSLFGMWTGSVAKSEVLKFLATHPEPVAAVFSTGNMGVGVGQAFEQSGRPVPIITEVTNLCSLLAYWKEKNLTAYTFVQDGGPMAYAAFIPALAHDGRSEAEGEHDLHAAADHHVRQFQRLL